MHALLLLLVPTCTVVSHNPDAQLRHKLTAHSVHRPVCALIHLNVQRICRLQDGRHTVCQRKIDPRGGGTPAEASPTSRAASRRGGCVIGAAGQDTEICVRLIWHEALDEVVVRIQALLNVCRERRVGCELGWCRRIEGPVIPQPTVQLRRQAPTQTRPLPTRLSNR